MSTIKSSTEHLTLNADGAGKEIKFQANGVEVAKVTSDSVSLGDNVKAKFGASDDLQIYHDGGHSYIKDTGVGQLNISGSAAVNLQDTSGNNMLRGVEGAQAALFYSGSEKLATTSTGIDVTGSVTCDTGVTSFATTANSQLYLTSPDTGQSAVNFGGTTSNAKGSIRYSDNSDWMSIYTNSSERLRIDSAGNVGIGTSSLFGESGGAIFVNDTYSRRLLRLSHSGSDSRHLIQFYTTASTLRVGYIATSPTAVTYATSSDYRLKENVVPMTGSIDRLKALKPSRFNFIADADKTVDGFLAHEAGEVVPECATGTKDAMKDEEYEVTPAVEATYDEDGNVITEAVEAVMGTRSVPDYQGIDQSKLVPLLVASLQEAVAKIESLEARVALLETPLA